MTTTYLPAQLGSSQVYEVRFYLGDTDSADWQLQDEEIQFSLDTRGNVYGATALCALALKGKYSRLVSISADGMSQALGQRVANYQALFVEYQRKEVIHYAMPSLYGVSVADMRATLGNMDRVPDIFRLGLFDNPPSDGTRPQNQPIGGSEAAEDDIIGGFLV